MSLIVFVVVTFGSAALAIAIRAHRPWALGIGLIGLAGAVVAALAIDPAQTLVIGGSGLATSAYLRLFLILGSLVGLGLTIAGLAERHETRRPGRHADDPRLGGADARPGGPATGGPRGDDRRVVRCPHHVDSP